MLPTMSLKPSATLLNVRFPCISALLKSINPWVKPPSIMSKDPLRAVFKLSLAPAVTEAKLLKS